MNDRDIERHSINCADCGALIDERESLHVYVSEEEREICLTCFENKGYTHCDVCEKTKPDIEIDETHGYREAEGYENICIKCWRDEHGGNRL